MQLNQEEIIMFRILIYGFTLVVLASTTTPNSEGGVEVRLLDNQNAPLMATLDMSKADERVKQFVSDAIEAKMKNIEQTMRSKQFVIETLDAKMKAIEGIMKSQIINFERNLTDQLTDYINKMVVKVDQENGKSSTYIRWGRSDCSGVNTEVVYSGMIFVQQLKYKVRKAELNILDVDKVLIKSRNEDIKMQCIVKVFCSFKYKWPEHVIY
ncbi:hypothetical protein AM593_00863, partial [Mytilus galloprovincialis]